MGAAAWQPRTSFIGLPQAAVELLTGQQGGCDSVWTYLGLCSSTIHASASDMSLPISRSEKGAHQAPLQLFLGHLALGLASFRALRGSLQREQSLQKALGTPTSSCCFLVGHCSTF